MAVTLFCRSCWEAYTVVGKTPPFCPACKQVAHWTTLQQPDPPTVAYDLTYSDRQFLRVLHIGEQMIFKKSDKDKDKDKDVVVYEAEGLTGTIEVSKSLLKDKAGPTELVVSTASGDNIVWGS